MTLEKRYDKAVIEAVEKLPETFTWKMLSKKLNVLGHYISPKTTRKRITDGVVNVERIDIGLYRKKTEDNASSGNKPIQYFFEGGEKMVVRPKTLETIAEHKLQLEYLLHGGYTQVAPQFIEHHCEQPSVWFDLKKFDMSEWYEKNAMLWESGYWKASGLRPTADVGMLWVR